jgi:hypothetical protein
MEERDAGAASGTSSEAVKSVTWDSDEDDSSSSDDASGAAPSSWRFSDLKISSRTPNRGVEVVFVAVVEECSSWWS